MYHNFHHLLLLLLLLQLLLEYLHLHNKKLLLQFLLEMKYDNLLLHRLHFQNLFLMFLHHPRHPLQPDNQPDLRRRE